VPIKKGPITSGTPAKFSTSEGTGCAGKRLPSCAAGLAPHASISRATLPSRIAESFKAGGGRIIKDPSLSSVIRSRLPRIENLKPSDQSKGFPLSLTFPIRANLKDGSPVELVLAGDRDVEPLRDLYRIIVEEGTSYPHDRFPDDHDFMDYWFRGRSTVAAYAQDRADAAPMAGAFYLKSNWPGRARQVANAGFMVAPEWRKKGLGWLLGATMLEYAKQLGYRSVLFNLVFSENAPARHLWEKLGFRQLGVIPSAVRKDSGTYQDAVIMFRSLL
jgi:L-amino acid N-acyltransferase YncA